MGSWEVTPPRELHTQEWDLHLRAVGVSDIHRKEAKNVSLGSVQHSRWKIDRALRSHAIDYLSALAVSSLIAWNGCYAASCAKQTRDDALSIVSYHRTMLFLCHESV